MRIGLPRQNVVSSRVAVVDCCDLGRLWCPWIGRLCILFVLRPLNHAIEQALEGSLFARRLRTNVIGGAPREVLSCHAQALSIEFAIFF